MVEEAFVVACEAKNTTASDETNQKLSKFLQKVQGTTGKAMKKLIDNSEEVAKDAMRVIDNDGSKTLSEAEFVAGFQTAMEGYLSELVGLVTETMSDAPELFATV